MQLWRFIKGMFWVTILALIYIHMQVGIFSLAYDGKQKEQHITRLQEQNGRVANNIFELKSANYIGQKMLNREAKLKFYDEQSIIQIVASKPIAADQGQLVSHQDNTANSFTRFLAWRFPREAQAKEDQPLKPWERGQR